MAATDKDTIYIDIDDEITGIIDKLRGSDGKIVALVLPKRASVFQSVVNMKLLKRAADEAKKNVVLITTEAGLLPLAGMAGVHVAKTLTSKPEIPLAPTADDAEETVQESGDTDADEPEITPATAGNKTVGQLAGLGAAAVAADGMETVEMDDDEADDGELPVASKSFEPPKDKVKKDKKLHVPNFERFRLLLVLGALIIILLIVGLVFAASVLPKATINITTDATAINANLNLNLSTTAGPLNTSTNTIQAKLVQQQKTYTQQVATTGTKNEGATATGSVTMSDCVTSFNSPPPVPEGSGISTNGLTYITQATTTFSHSGTPNGKCEVYDAVSPTDITAQSGGSSYNAPANSDFSVAGRSDVSASGSASGGTDDNVQIVSQSDIDSAKSKINTTDPTVKQALQNQLSQTGYYAIPATYSAGTPTVTTSANVGDAANTVTVTEVVTDTMFGAYQSDLKTLVDNNVKSQIDTNKQSILSEGLATATFSVNSSTATGAQLTMATTATAGPELNIATIKQEVVGKKSGDIKSLLETDPDVTGVTVKLSPFWVTTVPKKTSKITITIAKPTAPTRNTNVSNP